MSDSGNVADRNAITPHCLVGIDGF